MPASCSTMQHKRKSQPAESRRRRIRFPSWLAATTSGQSRKPRFKVDVCSRYRPYFGQPPLVMLIFVADASLQVSPRISVPSCAGLSICGRKSSIFSFRSGQRGGGGGEGKRGMEAQGDDRTPPPSVSVYTIASRSLALIRDFDRRGGSFDRYTRSWFVQGQFRRKAKR